MAKQKYEKVYVHRMVAEQKIGRSLYRGEVVHHIDHDATNNHPDNLEVCSSASVHRLHHQRSLRDKLAVDRPLERDGDLWF